MNFMLDSNAFDQIIVDPELIKAIVEASRLGKMRILVTHVQEDELKRMPDIQKLNAIAQIPREVINTSGAIYRVSKYGQAVYGNANINGLTLADVQKGNPKHAEDALIALTAFKHADVLVTEDRPFRNKVKKMQSLISIWAFSDFKTHVLAL